MIRSPLDSILARVTRRMTLGSGRGRVQLVDDSGVIQKMQVQSGPFETQSKVRRIVEFGFTSYPPKNSDALLIYIAGDRGNAAVAGTNDQQTRLRDLSEGDAAIYDATGRYIWLKKDGGIVVEAKNGNVTVNNAAEVTIHASTRVTLDTPQLHVTGEIVADGEVTGNGIPLSTHKHTGVQTGSGETGGPTA